MRSHCEDGKDKIAFQGTKQLSYQGPDGNGSCTYNWSKSAAIEKLTTIFESIAFTLEEGRRLAVEHKHDRLALDAELGELLVAVKDGRALEVQSIQPVLQEIAEDDAVLEPGAGSGRKSCWMQGTRPRRYGEDPGPVSRPWERRVEPGFHGVTSRAHTFPENCCTKPAKWGETS